jgi:hypothetical protein
MHNHKLEKILFKFIKKKNKVFGEKISIKNKKNSKFCSIIWLK